MPKKRAKHLTWNEVNSILGQITDQLNGVMRYLPPEHPESFCQSIAVAGIALDKLANEAGKFVSKPPQGGGHTHG